MTYTPVDVFRRAVAFKYTLNEKSNPTRTLFSSEDDDCFECLSDDELAKLIYNAILDYAYDNYTPDPDIDQNRFKRALQARLRYNQDASRKTQLKYGFYGEVLFHVLLKCHYGTECIISKGNFYDPLNGGEPKGYDSYHILNMGGVAQLWFGEVKFHRSFRTAINSVMGSIETAISGGYFQKNLIAIAPKHERIGECAPELKEMLMRWDDGHEIVLQEELQRINAELIYPVLIAYDGLHDDYDDCITSAKAFVDSKFGKYKVDIDSLPIPAGLFFIFLPVDDSANIKGVILDWIESGKPHM